MMIETRGLRKAFGDHVVLDGIDLNVAEGTIFALLGPNGAGKTTMVHILSTLIKADGSEARVAEYDVVREPDAGAAAGDYDQRQQRGSRRRLVRGSHPGRIPVGTRGLQP